MAEHDIRAILEAFAEKGWLVFEYDGSLSTAESEADRQPPLKELILGPVDNLVPGTSYLLYPMCGSPGDVDEVYRGFDDGTDRPHFMHTAEKIPIHGFTLLQAGRADILPMYENSFRVDDLEKAVREHLLAFDYEAKKRCDEEVRLFIKKLEEGRQNART
jgi:hypothetical protein